MKDKHRFYAACLIAVLALGAIGIGYATGTLPLHKQSAFVTEPLNTTDTIQAHTKTTAPKKKNCACCTERMAKIRERMAKIRTQKQPKKNESIN